MKNRRKKLIVLRKQFFNPKKNWKKILFKKKLDFNKDIFAN